jgi:polyisoprenoid-binding protein YceI
VLAADSLRDRQTALSDADRRKVDGQAAGPDGLDAAGHPEVAYRSTGVTLDGGAGEGVASARGTLHGELSLRGRTRPVDVAFEAERGPGGWRVRGRARLKQSDFGIEPFSGFAGTIGVKDEVEIELAILLAARVGPGTVRSPQGAAARGAAPR